MHRERVIIILDDIYKSLRLQTIIQKQRVIIIYAPEVNTRQKRNFTKQRIQTVCAMPLLF